MVLFGSAAIALAVGLGPMMSRLYQEHLRRDKVEQQQAQLQQEVARQTEALQANKPEVMAEIRALQASGQHDRVLQIASQYRLVNDADIRALYSQSAQEVSLRQTLDRMEAFASEHCNEATVRESIGAAFAEAYPDAPSGQASQWEIKRLDTSAHVSQIHRRIRAWSQLSVTVHDSEKPGHSSLTAASTLEALRGTHRPRIQPAVAYMLMQGKDVARWACVWRVTGSFKPQITGPLPTRAFVLNMWLVPSATERGMERDILDIKGF
ncbi:MAG: hypothetical protein J0L74_12875 [Burkholderiales bacterium]|nr:hypothetical protein [Burkholderiales bacterium]